jgi:hypothetical protein
LGSADRGAHSDSNQTSEFVKDNIAMRAGIAGQPLWLRLPALKSIGAVPEYQSSWEARRKARCICSRIAGVAAAAIRWLIAITFFTPAAIASSA